MRNSLTGPNESLRTNSLHSVRISKLKKRNIAQSQSKSPSDELREIAEKLQSSQKTFGTPTLQRPVTAIVQSALAIGKAWSGSWIGFESRIYYDGLSPTPPGCYFQGGHSPLNSMMNSAGQWVEYSADAIEGEIYRRAKNPDLKATRSASRNLSAL